MKLDLTDFVEQYNLRSSLGKIWTPYWINSDEPPFWLDAPYVGKATPTELERELDRLSRQAGGTTDLRQLMRSQGLGVDCSGFVYYVMSRWLEQQGIVLADQLLVDRAEILDRHKRRPELAEDWPEIPAQIALGEACRRWQKDPAKITNVARLTDERVVELIAQARSVRPGDFIRMSHDGSDHIGVVIWVEAGLIRYADSAHEPPGLGGVRIRDIVVRRSDKGLDEQDWEQKRLYHPGSRSRDGAWRLRVMPEALV
jgi:hypothetical protein